MSYVGGIYRSFIHASTTPAKTGLPADLRNRFSVVRMYARSHSWARKSPGLASDLRTYVLFMGHARSGGTLAGALLDAHPNAIIADEVDVFPYVKSGFTREQIFHILLERSRKQANNGHLKAGREAKQYSYFIPGSWQGRFEKLLVIGNRKAGISTQRIGSDPYALSGLKQRLGTTDLKIIVSLRNPYDTISTMSIRSGRELESGVAQYFANCVTIEHIRNTLPPDKFLFLRHEDLLSAPDNQLRRMCSFLEIPALIEYVNACSNILYSSPASSRVKVSWSPELVQDVKKHIELFSFLEGYSYDI